MIICKFWHYVIHISIRYVIDNDNLVPTTLDEYCIKTQINNPTDDEDNFDWDPYDDEDDDEDMESDEDQNEMMTSQRT